jgi:hypothetical protein
MISGLANWHQTADRDENAFNFDIGIINQGIDLRSGTAAGGEFTVIDRKRGGCFPPGLWSVRPQKEQAAGNNQLTNFQIWHDH